MSKMYKKTWYYLNHIEHLLILVSSVAGCVSISAFTSLVCVPVGVTISAVEIKFLHSLQELKRKSQLSRKRRKSMMK